MLTINSPRRVKAPHFNMLSFLKKATLNRHNPDVPSFDQLQLTLDVQKGLNIQSKPHATFVTLINFPKNYQNNDSKIKGEKHGGMEF